MLIENQISFLAQVDIFHLIRFLRPLYGSRIYSRQQTQEQIKKTEVRKNK